MSKVESWTPGFETSDPSSQKSGEIKKRMSIFEMIRSPRRALRENITLFRFLLVGASGAIVNIGLLALQERVFHIGEGSPMLLLANAVAVETSIINNFLWNDRYTFGHVRRASKPGIRSKFSRLGRYNLLSLVTFFVNEAIFYLLTQRFNFNSILSSMLAIVVSFAVNYLGSSRWAWKHKAWGADETISAAASSEPSS